MAKFLMLIVSSVVGSIGWWLGSLVNMDLAFLLSTVGSIVGLYYGWKWGDASSY